MYMDNIEQYSGRYDKSLILTNFPEGVYIIQLATENRAILKKLVVMQGRVPTPAGIADQLLDWLPV